MPRQQRRKTQHRTLAELSTPLYLFSKRLGKERKQKLCEAVGISTQQLSTYATGSAQMGADRVRKIVACARKLFPKEPDLWITLSEVRPDLWPPEQTPQVQQVQVTEQQSGT